MPKSLALVDDDRNIITSLAIALEAEGYEVDVYFDGSDALRGLIRKPVDLAVVDIKMPRMNGIELLQRIRAKSTVPIIFLTSKDNETDELNGLKVGADDYITKPFSQSLLIGRIHALLRRRDMDASDGVSQEIMRRGALIMNPSQHSCSWKGMVVNLTVTEFLLLESLAKRPGHVKSRDQLIDAAYGENIYVDDRTIDSHVKRLRKKFRALDAEFSGIETLYGIGYRYQEGMQTAIN